MICMEWKIAHLFVGDPGSSWKNTMFHLRSHKLSGSNKNKSMWLKNICLADFVFVSVSWKEAMLQWSQRRGKTKIRQLKPFENPKKLAI